MNINAEIGKLTNQTTPSDKAPTFPTQQKVQTSFKRPRDAADASTCPFRPKMRRSYSLPQLDQEQKTEKEECEARSGHLWRCVGRKPSPFGGYVYLFESREKFNDFAPGPDLEERKKATTKKIAEIYPAIEGSVMQTVYYDPNFDLKSLINPELEKRLELTLEHVLTVFPSLSESDIQHIKANVRPQLELEIQKEYDDLRKHVEDLKYLGYRFSERAGQVVMELPDRKALLGAWQGLKEKHPEKDLRSLNILSSKGIADDISFIEAHFLYDGVLSDGKEFCHDHLAHVIKRIERMLDGNSSYTADETRLKQLIWSVYRSIHIAKSKVNTDAIQKNWDHLCFISGALTDSIYSLPKKLLPVVNEEFVIGTISTVWEDPNWLSYIQGRFPNQTPTNASMGAVWKEVTEEVAKFDKELNLKKAGIERATLASLSVLSEGAIEAIYENPIHLKEPLTAGILIEDLAKLSPKV